VPMRLGEVVLRVEEHDLDVGHGLDRDVDEHAVLERRGQHDTGAEAFPRPLDRGRCGLLLQLAGYGRELTEIDVDQRSRDRRFENAHVPPTPQRTPGANGSGACLLPTLMSRTRS